MRVNAKVRILYGLDFTISIRRMWSEDSVWTDHETWRHFTCYVPFHIIFRRKPLRVYFDRFRFGFFLGGNGRAHLYLGLAYLSADTAFRGDPRRDIRLYRLGPVEWAK